MGLYFYPHCTHERRTKMMSLESLPNEAQRINLVLSTLPFPLPFSSMATILPAEIGWMWSLSDPAASSLEMSPVERETWLSLPGSERVAKALLVQVIKDQERESILLHSKEIIRASYSSTVCGACCSVSQKGLHFPLRGKIYFCPLMLCCIPEILQRRELTQRSPGCGLWVLI